MPAVIKELRREQFVTEEVLREIEQMVADARRGVVTSLFCVADYGPEAELMRVSSFNDRLRALGALEYLKDGVSKA